MTLTWGWDATHANLGGVPAGQGAGYTTGTPDIMWTPEDWAAHPGAVRICQAANGNDDTADVIDDEPGADSDSGSVGWYQRAQAARARGDRPGQRPPAFYRDLDGVPELASAVQAAGLSEPCPLYLAHWGITMDQAAAAIGTRTGPFVIVGVQFANRGAFDSDVFDSGWLADTSPGAPQPPVTPPASEGNLSMANMPELAQGATGGPVRSLQGLLVARGFHLGTTGPSNDGVDGNFGPLTHAAVVAFQEESNISADGVVGPITWPLLPIS